MQQTRKKVTLPAGPIDSEVSQIRKAHSTQGVWNTGKIFLCYQLSQETSHQKALRKVCLAHRKEDKKHKRDTVETALYYTRGISAESKLQTELQPCSGRKNVSCSDSTVPSRDGSEAPPAARCSSERLHYTCHVHGGQIHGQTSNRDKANPSGKRRYVSVPAPHHCGRITTAS